MESSTSRSNDVSSPKSRRDDGSSPKARPDQRMSPKSRLDYGLSSPKSRTDYSLSSPRSRRDLASSPKSRSAMSYGSNDRLRTFSRHTSHGSYASSSPRSRSNQADSDRRRHGREQQQIPWKKRWRQASVNLLRALMCGLRRTLLAAHRWIEFPERELRARQIEGHYKTIVQERLTQYLSKDEKMSRYVYFAFLCTRWYYYTLEVWMRIRRSLEGHFHVTDPRTGLPLSLFLRFRLKKLFQEGPHGSVFVGTRRNEEFRISPPEYAIRVRDKSKMSVYRRLFETSGRRYVERIVVPSSRNYIAKCHGLLTRRPLPVFDHVCLVRHFAFFDSLDFYVEIMEKLARSMHEYLASGSLLNEYEGASVATRLFEALSYLQSYSFIHRDVRLRQLLLVDPHSPSTVKLGDFWCMAVIPDEAPCIFDRHFPVDLVAVAPEVIKHGAWSFATDIWMAACALFEAIYGHPPFGGSDKALLARILTASPEFDRMGSTVSRPFEHFLRPAFCRQMEKRPTAEQMLEHSCLSTFLGETPESRVRRDPIFIEHVQLVGKVPKSRGGTKPTNVIGVQPGTLSKGFCSQVGVSSVAFEFEIRAPSETQEYFVTSVTVALWGTEENPRFVRAMVLERLDQKLDSDVGKRVRVEAAHSTTASVPIGQVARYIRVILESNFGGFGIAVRRISFYGYAIASAPVVIDFNSSHCFRGCSAYAFSERIIPQMAETYHPHVLPLFELGELDRATLSRPTEYRDLFSGEPYKVSSLVSQPVKIEPGSKVQCVKCNFLYHTNAPVGAEGPGVKVHLLYRSLEEEMEWQEKENPSVSARRTDAKNDADAMARVNFGTKVLLFELGPFTGPEHTVEEITTKGYSTTHSVSIPTSVSTDNVIRVEVTMRNSQYIMHIPRNFGMVLYYVPRMQTPRKEGPSLEEAKADQRESITSVESNEVSMAAPRVQEASGEPWKFKPNKERQAYFQELERIEGELLEQMTEDERRAYYGEVGYADLKVILPDGYINPDFMLDVSERIEEVFNEKKDTIWWAALMQPEDLSVIEAVDADNQAKIVESNESVFVAEDRQGSKISADRTPSKDEDRPEAKLKEKDDLKKVEAHVEAVQLQIEEDAQERRLERAKQRREVAEEELFKDSPFLAAIKSKDKVAQKVCTALDMTFCGGMGSHCATPVPGGPYHFSPNSLVCCSFTPPPPPPSPRGQPFGKTAFHVEEYPAATTR